MKTESVIKEKLNRIQSEYESEFDFIKRRVLLYGRIRECEWRSLDKKQEEINFLKWVLE